MPNQGILSLCEAKKMGLTDFWKSPTDKRADEVRSGAVAPSRTERRRCWESRDAYFACLDRNNILDAIKDDKAAAKQCSAEAVGFEKDCAAEWVSRMPNSQGEGERGGVTAQGRGRIPRGRMAKSFSLLQYRLHTSRSGAWQSTTRSRG